MAEVLTLLTSPLCQNEVPLQSPTDSHFESIQATDVRSEIWGCHLAGSFSVNAPPFARATTHPHACSHAPSLFAPSVIRSVALHSVAFSLPSLCLSVDPSLRRSVSPSLRCSVAPSLRLSVALCSYIAPYTNKEDENENLLEEERVSLIRFELF